MSNLNEQIERKARELHYIHLGFTEPLIAEAGFDHMDEEYMQEYLRLARYIMRCELEARLDEQDHDSKLSWDIERINELRVQIERLKES